MKRFTILFLVFAFIFSSGFAQKRKAKAVGKDAIAVFRDAVTSDLRDDGRDTIATVTTVWTFRNTSGGSGEKDLLKQRERFEFMVSGTDTTRLQKLYLAGATDTDPIFKGKSDARLQFGLGGVRPEDMAQFARKAGRVAEVLDPITGSNFRGILAVKVTFTPRLLPVTPPAPVAENPKLAAMQADIDSLNARRIRDSVAAANRPSLLSNVLSSLTVGGGVIGRSTGSETLRGINGGVFFQDSKGMSQEFGYMGLGSYTRQGGSTIYSLTSFRLSGDKVSGVDFTVALGHSWFQRTDKNENVAPFRTKQYPFAGAGITGYFRAVVPFRLTLTLNYQPEIQIFEGMTKFLDHAVSVWIKMGIRPLWFFGE
ncbi:MAG: hypothetical protein Q7S84_00200 [bacterium]|nr:hypothetical protein [bacterium]